MVHDFGRIMKSAILYNPASTEEGAAILKTARGFNNFFTLRINLSLLPTITYNRIAVRRIRESGKRLENEKYGTARRVSAGE